MPNQPEDQFFLPDKGGLILDKQLIASQAFRELSGLAIHIYLMLWLEARNVNAETRNKRKKRYYVLNNGELKLPYSQIAQKLGKKPKSFGGQISRAFSELIDRGLIDLTIPGCGKCRAMNQYGFSNRWRQYGKPNFQKADNNRQNFAAKKRAQNCLRDNGGRFLKNQKQGKKQMPKKHPAKPTADGKYLKGLVI